MAAAVEQRIQQAPRGVPLARPVLEQLFVSIPEPTEREIFTAAQQAQNAYRDAMEERIAASCSRVRSRQEVALSQQAAPVRRVHRTKSAQKNRPVSYAPDPLTASIHQLISYYQETYTVQNGKSGDFTGNPSFVSALRQRYLATF